MPFGARDLFVIMVTVLQLRNVRRLCPVCNITRQSTHKIIITIFPSFYL